MTWILTAYKVVTVSIVAVVLAFATKLCAPLATELLASSSMMAWLRPPYLYVLVNGIIISIAASSRFHSRGDHHDNNTSINTPDDKLSSATNTTVTVAVVHHHYDHDHDDHDHESDVAEVKEVIKEGVEYWDINVNNNHDYDGDDDDLMKKSARSTETVPERTDSWQEDDRVDILKLSAEKPLLSARLGYRKPSNKPCTTTFQGDETKPWQHETMEDTWKAIMEKRSMELSMQMKKCDTWENHDRQLAVVELKPPAATKKSETFKDRTNQMTPRDSPLRKDPSLSQDELNKRVEAFIKKFNDEMRLQRQKSLNHQYMELINRGGPH